MKAYVLESVGNIKYKDVDEPQLKSGWVLLKVKAAGICSSDIPRVFTTGTYHFPTIPGHEFCGEVVKVFDESDKKLIGKRMGVFPLIPCKKCEFCRQGHYEMCKYYDYLGSRRDGGFAEFVAVPTWNLIELPKNVSYEQAAVLEPLAVAYHAISSIDYNKVSNVGIVGTGAIALFVAIILKSKKIDVTIIGRNENKRNLVKKCGIEKYIVSSNENDFSQYDVVCEAVGSNDSLIHSIEITKSGGQLILIGNPYSNMTLEKNIYWQILRRQLIIRGTWNSMYDNNNSSDWSNVIAMLAKGQINTQDVITHILKKENLLEGLEIMKNHKEIYGRIVVKFDE